ncbi:MAG: efflux transporter periplasmic adaptor subunit, partial [Bacteroidaceae bacterium]|nr:efflux transporter periplasmic adaptor subunit [Bacteroidaceae bacterium]
MDIKRPPKPWYVKYRMYILGVTALLAIVVYTVYIALQPRRQSIKSESIKVAAVQDAPFMEFVETEGIVQPIMTIQINSKESGYVDRIVAEEGTMLHKGDTILILQNPELIR